jgi:PAS domain S-box-containing protein
MLDNQMRYVVASRRWLEDYNLGDIHIIGRSHYEIFPEIPERWKEIHRRCLAGTIEKCEEDRFVRADGSVDWVRWEVHPWTTIDDRIGGIIMFTEVITDRKQAAEARERLVAELEAKNTQLEQFTYTVSHDLKTPLITIRGFAGAIEDDLQSGKNDRMQADLKHIANAAERMQHLLDDLLDLSRIGQTANPSENMSFDHLIEEALLFTAGRIAEAGVEVVVKPSAAQMRVDRVRIVEAIVNLIDNAAKFGGNSPRVEIGCKDVGKHWMVYVEDNGIGIEPQYHDKIFGLFDRLDPVAEGTGIGLTLVKRIVEVHGGRIWVESEGNGKGSRFCFTLPKQVETEEKEEKDYVKKAVNHTVG